MKLETIAAMETATPEKMMMIRSVRDKLNLQSLKLPSDNSLRNIFLSSMGTEHWISLRPAMRQKEKGGVKESVKGPLGYKASLV